MISNCGSDERGRYTGGQAGDQTGREWQVIPWYNRPWNYVLRHPDQNVGNLLADLARKAAQNDNIGYDQGGRTTYWTQLLAAGYAPEKIAVKCEADCSSGVSANVKAAGYILGIPALQNVSKDLYTGNMRQALRNAGFEVLTDKRYMSSDEYLKPGDILLYEGHHTAINLDLGKKVPGWHQDEYGWWWVEDNGDYVRMGWKLINHHWYLFGNSGYMLTGWVQWDGQKTGAGDWYYLEDSGEYQGACWHGKADNGSLERWYVD